MAVGMMFLGGCGADGGGAGDASTGGQMTDPSGATVTDGGADPVGDPAGDPGGDPSAGGVCDGAMHMGEGTYYAADGSGNCSFDAAPDDPLVAAMNDADYADAAACGACVEVTGPDATIVVRIVDRCPECPAGDIDFSEAAFAMIAEPELGRVPIAWHYTSCPVSGPLVYRFKEGSSQYWTAVQVRNHRNAIATFEVGDGMGGWKAVTRLDYNYFVDDGGMGPGPYDFRVTDVEGNVVEDHAVPLIEAGEAPGAGQFPNCGG
jgi:expansin (peptidoglycan-binding protein)